MDLEAEEDSGLDEISESDTDDEMEKNKTRGTYKGKCYTCATTNRWRYTGSGKLVKLPARVLQRKECDHTEIEAKCGQPGVNIDHNDTMWQQGGLHKRWDREGRVNKSCIVHKKKDLAKLLCGHKNLSENCKRWRTQMRNYKNGLELERSIQEQVDRQEKARRNDITESKSWLNYINSKTDNDKEWMKLYMCRDFLYPNLVADRCNKRESVKRHNRIKELA